VLDFHIKQGRKYKRESLRSKDGSWYKFKKKQWFLGLLIGIGMVSWEISWMELKKLGFER